MKKRSKRYQELKKFSTKGKKITLKEVFDLVKKTSTSKFDRKQAWHKPFMILLRHLTIKYFQKYYIALYNDSVNWFYAIKTC